MEENINWSVWKDELLGFSFGPKEFSKDQEIVEEFELFEEAKKAWKFYNFFLINKNEQK
jgi:hypothetical protein